MHDATGAQGLALKGLMLQTAVAQRLALESLVLNTANAQRLAVESFVLHGRPTASLGRRIFVEMLPVVWVCFLDQLQINSITILLSVLKRGLSWNQLSRLGSYHLFG